MKALLLAGALLLSTLPAQAQTRVACGIVSGMDYCITDTQTEDIILLIGPDGGERITVDCATRKWNSYGKNTEQFVQNMVNLYCSNSIN